MAGGASRRQFGLNSAGDPPVTAHARCMAIQVRKPELNWSTVHQQAKNATGRAQTRVFAGFGALFGKEPDREQREKTGPNGPEMGAVRRMPLKRPAPGTAPTLALRAEKNLTDKGWVFRYWWRGGGSNSRPPHCERGALPAELPPHALQGAIICALMRSCNKGSRAMQGEHWRAKYSSGGCC